MSEAAAPFIIGWEEWVALPGLGLPAIKAKIDTGARTSALHAFRIDPFGPADRPMVRFAIHPIPGRTDIEIICSAPVADRRDVTSSNGERETRYIIATEVEIGGRSWPIEVGLTNRAGMAYRMLLGRQAIRDDMMVEPASSFRQPRLSYRLYRNLPPRSRVRRALRIALVARNPASPTNTRLQEAASARGHVLERLDLDRLQIAFDDAAPGLRHDGVDLAHYDAVVPRIGAAEGAFGAAVIRQLELMGCYALNSGDALDRRLNKLATQQALAYAGLRQCLFPASQAAMGEPVSIAPRPPVYLRFLVVGGRAVAALQRRHGKHYDTGGRRHRSARRLAERAATVMNLGLATIDIDETDDQPCVIGVFTRPQLARFERLAGVETAALVIDCVEARSRSLIRHTEGEPAGLRDAKVPGGPERP